MIYSHQHLKHWDTTDSWQLETRQAEACPTRTAVRLARNQSGRQYRDSLLNFKYLLPDVTDTLC